MHSIAIIIPTFNRPRDLASTVTQLCTQTHTDFALWVIDQSDADAAAANQSFIETSNDPRLHYLHLTRKNLPNARNEGIARIAADIVLFVDDDVILLSDDFIGAHLRCYTDPTVGGVTGRHIERHLRMNARHTACHVSWGGRTIFNLFGTERMDIRSCKGSNMSFRMAAVHQVGGFDRRTHMLEDTDFSVRIRTAGWRLIFEPAAELVHLSTPAGGVREAPGLATECRRFQSTAYYIGKHRGAWGKVAFVATFALIALLRAWRYRSFAALPALAKATGAGFAEAQLPPDQSLLPQE